MTNEAKQHFGLVTIVIMLAFVKWDSELLIIYFMLYTD